jgi:hypothetical protein
MANQAAAGGAGPLNAQLTAKLQLQSEIHKGTLKIPHFYGEPVNDTLTINEFFERYEGTMRSAEFNDDDAGKIAKIYNYLENTAKVLYNRIFKWTEVPRDDYNAFKEYFLVRFGGKLQAHNTAATFERLKQKPGETVMTFATRVTKETEDWARSITIPEEGMTATYRALSANDKAECLDFMLICVHKQISRTLFMSGIKDSIKTELQRKSPETMDAAQLEAIKLEETEAGKKGSRVHELAEMDDQELNELKDEELDTETIEHINYTRSRQGRQPYRRFFNKGNGNNGNNGFKKNNNGNGKTKYFNGECLFCHKRGHMQKDCRTRINSGAPMKTNRPTGNDTDERRNNGNQGVNGIGFGIDSIQANGIYMDKDLN